MSTGYYAKQQANEQAVETALSPLPPLRPNLAASGVAGLRSGSGQGDARRASMAEPLASKPQPEAISLNI